MALSAGLAIAVSLCILSFQIASVSGNFLDGFHHVKYTLQKRTHHKRYNTKQSFSSCEYRRDAGIYDVGGS